ncbi:MAG: lipocalin family protein [Candidatus Delongbacteria bacterium]|jgi:apolipoprotein D and lipocalin family protein|nr:lipocalin family protein [Candidatus Delongbacteria bacterium]
MKKFIFFIFPVMLFSCKTTDTPTQVGSVDIDKYAGTWYEIARYPTSFEKDCECVTATYIPNGRFVRVINRCRKNDEAKDIKGKAFPVKGSQNTKLKVQFFWPFRAGYWIIALDNDYQWALVGSPKKDYFWILARENKLPDDTMQHLFDIMKKNGYDKDKLIFTKHKNCNYSHK